MNNKSDKVFIAFRATSPTSPTKFQRLACWVTKTRLVSKYCHGGIVVGTGLLHVTTARGLHKEPVEFWTPENWELYEVDIPAEQVLEMFEKHKGARYDWFSLLAFVGLPVSDASKLYCYEWMWIALTKQNPKIRITPEMIFARISNNSVLE